MNSFDVVAVGNATLDIFLWVQETNKHFRLNEETKEFIEDLKRKLFAEALRKSEALVEQYEKGTLEIIPGRTNKSIHSI